MSLLWQVQTLAILSESEQNDSLHIHDGKKFVLRFHHICCLFNNFLCDIFFTSFTWLKKFEFVIRCKLTLFVQQYQTHGRSIGISPLVPDSHSRANFWRHCSLYTMCISAKDLNMPQPSRCLATWSCVHTNAANSFTPLWVSVHTRCILTSAIKFLSKFFNLSES